MKDDVTYICICLIMLFSPLFIRNDHFLVTLNDSTSECDCSDHPVSVVVVVVDVNFFSFFDFFSQTAAWICFKFCVDVPLVNPY